MTKQRIFEDEVTQCPECGCLNHLYCDHSFEIEDIFSQQFGEQRLKEGKKIRISGKDFIFTARITTQGHGLKCDRCDPKF